MTHGVHQARVRGKHVERMSHTDEHLVRLETLTHLHQEWVVRLGNPDVVASMAFALHPHNLHRCGRVHRHARSGRDSSNLLEEAAEEGIA